MSLSSLQFYKQIRFLFLISTIGAVGCTSVMVATPPSVRVAMDNASSLRDQAEQRVVLVKKANTSAEINLDQFERSKMLYEEARQSIGLWIDQLQNDLKTKKPIGESDEYRNLVNTANTKANSFNEYVDNTLNIISRTVTEEDVKAFFQSGIELAEKLKEIDQQKRLEIAADLEKLRWKLFDTI